MLVTKREVKQTSKKLLSLLLAVVMIMTSMSVCFGTISFAAGEEEKFAGQFPTYTEDALTFLAEKLESETIKNVAANNALNDGKASADTLTTNVALATYEDYVLVRDTVIYLHKAIVTSNAYINKHEITTDEYNGGCLTFEDIRNELLSNLKDFIGKEPSDAAKEFISYLLDDARAVKHFDRNKNKVNNNLTNTINVTTTDYKGYLEAHNGDYTAVDSAIVLGYTYSMKMFGKNGNTNLSYQHKYKDENDCDQTDTYYHHYMWNGAYDLEENPPKTISGSNNTEVKSKLTTYANYVDNLIATNTFEVMAAISLAEIEGLESNLDIETNTIKGYIADEAEGKQDDIYDKLFPGYANKIKSWKEISAKAKETAKYNDMADEIAAYKAANPDYGVFNWGGFDEATIKADYAEFMNTYGVIINDATLYDFYVKNGKIDATYVTNFKDNTVAYDLEDLKLNEIEPLYNKYALSFPMEGGEEIPLAEKQVAYSTLTGYINNVRTYSTQVQNAIFPETLNHLLDLQEKLECQVADCVLYFAEHVNKDYTDVLTEDVIAEIATAKSNLAALNALLASVDYEGNEALLDGAFDNADTFIAYLYSLLAARFTTQVDAADEVYTALGRPKKLDLAAFTRLNAYLAGIEEEILTFIDGQGQGALITQETRDKYNALKVEVFPGFDAFLVDRGFGQYKTEDLVIRREDDTEEIFRENEDLDNDGVGEYEVTKENVEHIINVLEGALQDPTVAKLLGDLINKDEDGNPTGEAFNLGTLLRELIGGIYSDSLMNTIVGFIYPAVADIFTDVWSTLPASITMDDSEIVPGMFGDVKANLFLGNVEDATAGLDMPLFPNDIADVIYAKFPAYSEVADVLAQATTAAKKLPNGTILSPWNDAVLYTDKVNEDGTTDPNTQVLNLKWGIDEAADKKTAFLNAAEVALYGLKPLLFALLCNTPMTQHNDHIGTGSGTLSDVDASVITINGAALTLNHIYLDLKATQNDGYNNVIAPLFEILGVKAPNSSTFSTITDVLDKGLLQPLDAFITKLEANPIETLLDVLPNLAYAAEADLLLTKLDYLETVITYSAGVKADVNLNTAEGVGFLMGILSGIVEGMIGMPVDDGIIYNVDAANVYHNNDNPLTVKITGPGGFIDIGEMLGGADLSSFAGIWEFLGGMVDMLAGVEAPDASYIATLGKLVEIDTVRSKKAYTWGTDGKAAYIEADKADVLQYLVKWVLESGLLSGLVAEPSELIATIFSNLENNSGDAVAALVELLNQKAYDAKKYEWFNGTIDGESVVGNSAYEIYLNPNNDWTKEKAEFLYNNLEALLTAALTMAGKELDLEATVADAIGGLLSDKTLTALAALLAKLDINALLNEGKTEEEMAKALDVNGLINQYLGLDLAAVAAQYSDIAAAKEANPEYVHNFGVDAGTTTFAAALADMLAPLSVVLDFILEEGNLELTIGGEKITLLGGNGYDNAIIPLLEALGCDVVADPANALEATINALVGKIEALKTNTDEDAKDGVIYGIIDMLPGLFYFITSGALSTTVLNLLQPVFVIIDTVRPVVDVMDIINDLEIGEEGAKKTLAELLGGELNIEKLDIAFIFNLLPNFIDLDLSGLKNVIYDICNNVATEYTSAVAVANTVNGKAKKGAYNAKFDQADLLTVVLSFVLEWATVADNAKALDELLKTDGLIEKIGTVFADMDISYGTPTWYYWLDSEEAFDEFLEGDKELPNTLAALEYPNDWSKESAEYIADNLASLVDMVIGLIKINGKKYESVAALLNDLVYGDFNITIGEGEEAIVINYLFSDETINALLGFLKGILANVDDVLLSAGYILDVDVVGLKNYTCEKEITTISGFFAELAYVLDTYAKGLVDLLFFGDDFRIAKKSDNTDTIVINGGLGYEKSLALILEALGCDVPAADEATTANILAALAARVEAILANPVNEVIGLLPNLVYFLNANGASVAVNNLLAPVYAILEKINGLGILKEPIVLEDILGFDLDYLSLADILALVKDKTGLDLSAAEKILVNLCFGKIEEGKFIYKMVAERKDVITVILTTALMLVKDADFAAKLEEMMGTDLISAITTVFESAPVTYKVVEWYALDENDINYDNATVGVIKYAIEYPNNWTEESAKYLADNLSNIGNMVAGIIDSNYKTLGDLLGDKVDIYTPDLLKSIQTLLGDLIGGLDADLKDLVNVGLGAADALLGADVQGLINYDVSGVKDKETFVAALTGMLMEVEGLVDWLLLGEDYAFFVDGDKNDIITINGGHGYAEGLALVLEALGVENLPDVYAMETIDTKAVLSAVLTATFNRVDAILADPINEVFELLPNLIYFINANGLGVAVENLIGAINALLIKLVPLGVELDIASLVNFSEILGVETELSLYNIKMADIVALVAELTGLNLDKIADVLVGFALGRVQVYESVSNELAFKMYYHDDFAKYDMITVLATVAIITLTDNANADKVKEMLGEEIYQLILNLINMSDVPVQDFNWQLTDKVGETFSAFDTSVEFDGQVYGDIYTEEHAQYIADNFGEFVNNIIYLLGLDINGDGKVEAELTEVINGLINGNLYNSANVIAIRDALAGILDGIAKLEVNGAVVGGHIAEILKAAKIADIAAVANVNVPEFTESKEKFIESLCDVLEPLYGILKYVLADEDFAFFVNAEKTDAITLKGAEGYAYGIIPLLETLGCEGILAPADYYAAVKADGDVLLTSILNPLLSRVEKIIENPAEEILAILPNLIYFINSNGVDTVVKNTLNAVYAVLAAIEPIAKLDLYEIIGIDLADINFEWLLNKLLEVLEGAGYKFEMDDFNAIAELTVGTLEEYTSLNGKTAYRMVYNADDSAEGGSDEMVTVIERLIITFITAEANQDVVIKFLRDKLGMTAETEKYVEGLIKLLADCINDTSTGMQLALSSIYYIFYGVEIGVGETAGSIKDVNNAWKDALDKLGKKNPAGLELIEEILGWDIFEDILDTDGLAPNGFISFFQKIINFFKSIADFFRNLFSFGR